WWPRLRDASRDLGQTASPDDLFLAIRGIRTLEARLAVHQEGGLAVARWLQERPEVRRVLHPALPDDPGHALWKRDFRGATGLFAIELDATVPQSHAFIEALECFALGYSWGGYESLVVPGALGRAARKVRPWAGGPLVRLHVGLEDPEDLCADLDRAFGRMRGA